MTWCTTQETAIFAFCLIYCAVITYCNKRAASKQTPYRMVAKTFSWSLLRFLCHSICLFMLASPHSLKIALNQPNSSTQNIPIEMQTYSVVPKKQGSESYAAMLCTVSLLFQEIKKSKRAKCLRTCRTKLSLFRWSPIRFCADLDTVWIRYPVWL